eukprot:scaffold178681_cov33-Tisochrysis_lutea.AAC.1
MVSPVRRLVVGLSLCVHHSAPLAVDLPAERLLPKVEVELLHLAYGLLKAGRAAAGGGRPPLLHAEQGEAFTAAHQRVRHDARSDR